MENYGCRPSQKGEGSKIQEKEVTIYDDLKHWAQTQLSKRLPSLMNLPPCPFAAQAFVENKVTVIDSTGWMFTNMTLAKEAFWEFYLQEKSEMLILVDTLYEAYTPEQMYACSDALLNDDNNGVWLIPFHPDSEGELSPISDYDDDDYVPLLGIDYAMCFVQPTSHLNKASRLLERRGYYENWEEDQLEDLRIRRRYGDGDG